MQTDPSLQIIDSAVDWLTCTAVRGDPADKLIALGETLLHQSKAEGNRVSSVGGHGYSGFKSGGVTYAVRKDDAMLTLTSREAASHWLLAKEVSSNVSRLDLQITCGDDSALACRAEIAYHLLQDTKQKMGRPVAAALRLNSWGGQTLYLGKPKSDVIARLYDKGLEQKITEAGRLWRFEVQFRRKSALRVSNAVNQSEARNDYIAALVAHHFSNRRVVVPDIERQSAESGFQYESYYLSKRETDADRSLKWLSAFIAPTIQRLIKLGKRDAVMIALGLAAPVDGLLGARRRRRKDSHGDTDSH